ncbi:MAG: hypothetical protein ACXWF0_05800 [Usitatibacter sp.]
MSLLKRIFASGADREGAERADPVIDRLVAATDKRLAYVKDYREVLRAPVLAAWDRMVEAVARIPGPTEVSARAWADDTTVRALFARATDVVPAFSNHAGVRAFFEAHPASDCVAMLALEQNERRVLASALHGDSVQAEVARRTVSFTDPQILAPGVDEAAVRGELAQRGLENLAMRALERVGARRAQKHALEKDRALLTARLQLAKRRGAGFGGLEGGPPLSELERDLERTVRELEQAASRNLLPGLLDELLNVLADPGEHLAVESGTLALDSMNFVVEPGPQAVVPRVAILRLARRPPYAVLIARFPRADLRIEDRLAEAEKFL